MDIQHLVDRLEDLIDEGRHMPFSKFTLIDEEMALEIIDQMRISIPEEIEKANRILAQRDRVLAQANEEAARILQDARRKGDELLDQDISVQAAQNRAANIIEQARQEAEQITGGADQYVMQVLAKLEQTLLKNLNTVRNGINEVSRSADNMIHEDVQLEIAQLPEPQETQSVEISENGSRRLPGISLKRADEVDQQ